MKTKIQNTKTIDSLFRRKEFIWETLNGPEKTYIKSKGAEVETLGFYLRFIGKHYEPCLECSKELAELLLYDANIDLGPDSASVRLQRMQGIYQFAMPFLLVKGEYHVTQNFVPCEKCQKIIKDLILQSNSLTIGNKDYAFPVELWKKCETDDKAWVTLEERPSTPEEQKRLKDDWFA